MRDQFFNSRYLVANGNNTDNFERYAFVGCFGGTDAALDWCPTLGAVEVLFNCVTVRLLWQLGSG